MSSKYAHLLSPLTIGSVTLKNRIMAAPTSFFDLGEKGHLTQAAIAHFEERARGGAAVVCIGDACVEKATGQHCFNQPHYMKHVFMDDHGARPGLATYADAMHAYGALANIELSHGGNMSSPVSLEGRNPIGPSGYTDKNGKVIEEMDEALIDHICNAFASAALTAKQCGFDMCMVHAGHGWLLHQFLSPLTNFRKDRFGGSLENRALFPLMVIDRVRKAVGPDFPIEVRMTGDEFWPGGYTIEDGVEFAKMLDGKVDLIHVSAGTNMSPASGVVTHPSIFQAHGHNVWMAARVKQHVKTPVATVGALSDPEKMEEILASGQADVINAARALIADPQLPNKLLHEQDGDITHCLRCLDCMGSLRATRTIRCAVNPTIGREIETRMLQPAKQKKKVLIVGGGPGGISAARTAAERGHEVILCEKEPVLGGKLYFADGISFKQNIVRYREFIIEKAMASGVDVRLNTAVTPALVAELKPDVLIAAVGADPVILTIPGANTAVIGADISVDTKIGKRVVIIGGGLIGCETGLHLANDGHEVTIIEMQPDIAMDCGHFHRTALMEEINKLDIRTGLKSSRIESGGAYAEDASGQECFFPADTVIMAVGMKPRTSLVESLRSLVPEFYAIGDCLKAGKILNAVRNGYDIAVHI